MIYISAGVIPVCVSGRFATSQAAISATKRRSASALTETDAQVVSLLMLPLSRQEPGNDA